MKRGLAYVEVGRTEEAFEIVGQLQALRYSGAFEIEAQALAREGRKSEAIEVLRKGLELAPNAWLIGNLLGNYLSDEGRFDEAFGVYEATLRVPTADTTIVAANFALALKRAGRENEARARIADVLAGDFSRSSAEARKFAQSVA